jgi:glycosyltransferase involved in cell wall biosynthesis
MVSVVIPAHNESTVIARTLATMLEGAEPGELDVVVVCNGCSDDTASIARNFGPPVRVVETAIASKPNALNVGDEYAYAFPRFYADADVLITVETIRALARRLRQGDVLAVAPTASIDITGCSWIVRAFYEIRALLPSANEGIGGSGVYALSEAGRLRFERFPPVTADDGYVRIQFLRHERETLDDANSIVFPPRTARALIATKTRAHFGSLQLEHLLPQLWQNRGMSNKQSLFQLFKYPRLWVKAAAYCFVTVASRRKAQRRFTRGISMWERDHTSRIG